MLFAIFSAIWLGILTSISPCPLTSNIAAIAYIEHGAGTRRKSLSLGALYTLGRVIAYVTLAGILAASLLEVPAVSQFLQSSMPLFLGPVLVITGVLLLELVPLPAFSGASIGDRLGERLRAAGALGALFLGMLFALAFCPISAVLFFGSLLPLSVEHGSWLLLPSLYGVGTALPLVLFVFVLALAREKLGSSFSRAQQIQRWMKPVTGVAVLGIGIYWTIRYVFLAEG